MNVSIVGIDAKKMFHNYVVVVLGQMMKSFACTFCFTFPFCVYAGTLPAGGFVLVHR